MNAFNEDTRVHIDVCRSSGNLFPFFPQFGKPFDPKGLTDVKLTRWTVDVTRGSPAPESAPPFARAQALTDFIGEFPRNDDRFQMRDYRHGWLLGFAGTRNSLGHVDLKSGALETWQAAATSPVMEPCFIPRAPDAQEGDGWVVQALTNGETMLTEVNLFVATEIANGPIATVKLPLRLKPAYHGSWSPSGGRQGPESALKGSHMLNYDDYIAVFNTGDDAALLERFFAEDVVFTGGTREYQGKAALRAFLDWAHDGVREVMRPQNVIRREDMIFADVDMDFHASKVRSDFPFGRLRPGDLVTVKFFVTYRLRGDRVVELKSMTWPPGKGVTSVPRLGPHPSQLAAFGAYVSAFSHGEFERFARFYTEDVRLELGSVPPILGRQGIIDFYKPMFERVSEKLRINSVQATRPRSNWMPSPASRPSRMRPTLSWPRCASGNMWRAGSW